MNVILKKYGFDDGQIQAIIDDKTINVIALTDTNRRNVGEFVAGKKIISSYDAICKYQENKDIVFLISDSLIYEKKLGMVEELSCYGVEKEHIYIYMSGELLKWNDYHFLPYIEYHVADHCNLNCRGCVHFSPLVDKPKFSDYEEVERDLIKLHEIVPYIGEIHILGGEPLLNKELYKYIELTSRVYPKSVIRVVTNGLLLLQIDNLLIQTMKRCNAEFAISLYKPMFCRIDETLTFLDSLGIKYSCSNPISTFSYTFDSDGGHACGVQTLNCSCPNLYHGKLAMCPPIAYIGYFNRKFNSCLAADDGMIDLYDEDMNYEKLVDELHTVRSICDRCLFISKEDSISIEWEQSKNAIEKDYVWSR